VMRQCAPSLIVAWCASASLGQSAVMRVSHNDPDGIVEPGQTVQITATLSWQNAGVLWDIRGGVRATGDAGIAANPVFPYNIELLPGRVLEPGTPVGGSVEGIWLLNGDGGFLAGWMPARVPWTSLAGIIVTTYDWTAPTTIGAVGFAWEPDLLQPSPLMFPTYSPNPWYISVPMTSIGASLTVVPGVGSGVVLAAGVGVMRRRSR